MHKWFIVVHYKNEPTKEFVLGSNPVYARTNEKAINRANGIVEEINFYVDKPISELIYDRLIKVY